MSRPLLLRLLDNFFRRWWLYLVPVALLTIVGAATVTGMKSEYQSVGTFNVESATVLSTINGDAPGNTTVSTIDSTGAATSPAAATSDRIRAVLQTDQFIKQIATKAKLDDALKSGQLTLLQIRSMIATSSTGNNLVSVRALTPYPELSQQLATATISTYVQGVVDTAVSQSTAAVSYFSDLLKTYQGDLDQAKTALNTYLTAHPLPPVGARPDSEATQVATLTDAVNQAQDQYTSALTKSQTAQLTTDQTKADIGQQLRVIDPPRVPSAPQAKLTKMALSMAVFIALGLVITLIALVVGTALDHSLRSADEVQDRIGLTALAVVPDTGGRSRRRRRGRRRKASRAAAPRPRLPVLPEPSRPLTPVPTATTAVRPAVTPRPAAAPLTEPGPTTPRPRRTRPSLSIGGQV